MLNVAFVAILSRRTLCVTISKKHVNINTPVMTLYLCRLRCLQGGASTALMIAAEQGSCDIITVLLEHGADINAVNTVGIEPNVVTV